MSRWHAWHLHYHDDLSLLLTELVSPLITLWLTTRQIDRFFFVRYQLGGPHLRLRLRLCSGASKTDLNRHLRDRARGFFRRWPSQKSWSEAKICALNAKLLDTDPKAGSNEIIADETLVMAPYVPETERYGGSRLVGPVHDFFMLSSAVALAIQNEKVASANSRPGRIRYLPYLLSQTLGSAGDLAVARTIARYPPDQAWKTFRPIVEKAEVLFDHQPEAFEHLCRETLTLLSSEATPHGRLAHGARYLARLLEGSSKRESILGSQLHMTANRLGLSNAEEIYLSHLATRCLDCFSPRLASPPSTLRPGEARRRLRDLLGSCCEEPLDPADRAP